jgi:hypothetical protein
MRDYLDTTGYGSTAADQRFALAAAVVGSVWLFGGLIICKLAGWL